MKPNSNRFRRPSLGRTAAMTALLGLAGAGATMAQLNPVGIKMALNGNGGSSASGGSLQPTATGALVAADSAGAPGYAQTNWNNAGRWGYVGPSSLKDQAGATTPISINFDCPDFWTLAGNATVVAQTNGDNKLMYGYMDSNATAPTYNTTGATVTGVNIYGDNSNKPWIYFTNMVAWMAQEGACSYDVVIYTDADTSGRGGEFWIEKATGPGGSMTIGPNLTPQVWLNVNQNRGFLSTVSPNPNYELAPLSSASAATIANANYTVFPGLQADSFLLRSIKYNTRAPLNGVQLIPHGPQTPTFPWPAPATPQTLYGGATATLWVPAAGGCGMTYQWQAGAVGSGVYTNLTDGLNASGAYILGSATATLTITNMEPAMAADYVLAATNSAGGAVSPPTTLMVQPQLIASAVPSEVLYPTTTAHFVTTVSSSGVNTYTWYDGTTALTDGPTGTGSIISGSGTPTLVVANVGNSDAGNYSMVVSNIYGMSTSAVSALSILPPPVPGSFAEAVVTNSPLAYWRFNEASTTMPAMDNAGGLNGTYGAGSVAGQTGTGYAGWANDPQTDLSFDAPNAANGWVTIPALRLNTNTVTIVGWVYLNGQQNNWAGILTSRHNGTAAGFNFSGLKPNMLTYTWDENTAATYDADTEVYVTNNVWTMVALVVTPTNASFYACDPAGGIRSAVYPYANNQELFYGPGTIGNDDTYATGRTMWGYLDDFAVFNHALTPTEVTWLYVAGSAADQVPPPTITTQPLSQELYPGQPAVFTVGVAGLPPFSYQWLSNGVPMVNGGRVSGATSATLTIANSQPGDAASYSVVVANNNPNSVTSNPATLASVSPTGAAYEAAVIASAPVGYWRLNEASGATYAWDLYGGHTASYQSYASATAGSATGPTPTQWPGFPASEVGLPLYWETPADSVAIPPLNLNTNTVTIVAWINPSAPQTTNNIGLVFSRQNLTTAGLTYGATSNHLGCNWNGAFTTADSAWDPGLTIPVGEWSFVASVFEPTRTTLYLYTAEGQLAAAHTVAHANQAFDGETYIGMDPIDPTGGRLFNGTMDEVAIWNTALTGPQIAALWTAAAGTPVPASVVLQPVPTTIYVGRTNSLTVTGAGTGPLAYQWYSNGVAVANGGDLVGAATSRLSFTNAALSDAANYTCVVTGPNNSATSAVAAVTILPAADAPVFTVSANNAATFANLTNQSGIIVGCEDFGATEYVINLTNGTVVTTYDFKVNGSVASVNGNGQTTGALNGAGSFGYTSGNATFDNVLNEFSYDAGPKTIVINGLIPGRQYTVQLFSLDDRDSTGGQHREQSRRGYFQDPYNLTNVSATFYMSNNVYVKATFTAAGTTQTLIEQLPGWANAAATDAGDGSLQALVVRDTGTTPAISYPPQSVTLFNGEPTVFSATFYGPPPMGYQWQRNTGGGFTNLPYSGTVTQPNSTTVTFTNPAVALGDTGSYRLVVTNSAGATTSAVAILTVLSPAAGSYAAAVLSYSPLAYWQFNEPAGSTTAYDYAGGFNGTYQPACTNGVPGVPATFPGFTAANLAFESVYGYTNSGVLIPALNFPATNTITWTAWVNPSSSNAGTEGYTEQNWTGLVMTRASTYASGIGYNNAGMLAYTWNGNNANTYGFVSGLVIPYDQWSFVAVAISPTNAALYLMNANGIQMTNNPIAHDAETWNGAGAIGLDPVGGATPFSRNFNGTVDEVAIFLNTLSLTAIQNIYSSVALTPPAAPTGLAGTAINNNTQVSLTWNASASAATYTVLRGSSAAGPFTPITTGLAGTAYVDPSPVLGAVNYYEVAGVNNAGTGAASAPVAVATIATTPPQLTFGMSAGLLQIGWPADHTGWHLQVQTNALNVGLSTNWVTIPSSSSTNLYVVPNDGNSDGVFFRLVLP